MAGLEARARALARARRERCVGLRVELDDFERAFAFGGVKATLALED